ncbi:MAG: hypothetical protein ACOX4U_06520 [Anaerovoracaceae bacterium]
MDIDQKLLMELAERAGIKGGAKDGGSRTEDVIDRLKGSSEDQLLNEIMALKGEIKKNPVQYERQLNAIRALAGMMSGEQRRRLDKVIALMESDD